MKKIVPIKDYENEYMISDDGVVFRRKEHAFQALKPVIDKDGYFKITLCKNNSKKQFFIHRLVAEMYIPNLDASKTIVNHKDENKQNNTVENLEWCTAQYNSTYNNVHFRKAESRRKPVVAFKNGEYIEFGSITEASKKLNTSHANILMCLQGKRKTAKGYTFFWKG